MFHLSGNDRRDSHLPATQRGKSNVSLDFKVLFERVTGKFPAPLSQITEKRKPRSMPRFPLLMPAVAAMFTRTAAQQYCNDSTLFSLYTELDTPCEALLADVFGEGM